MGERAAQRRRRAAKHALLARLAAEARAARAAGAAGEAGEARAREPPAAAAAAQLVRAVRGGDIASLGVVKLLHVDIDAPLERVLARGRDGRREAAEAAQAGAASAVPTWESEPLVGRTLLEEAALCAALRRGGTRRRGRVVNQLLRAGADASCGRARDEARALVRRGPSAFVAHVAIEMAKLRFAAEASPAIANSSKRCTVCGRAVAGGVSPLVRWEGCGHYACEPCAWRHAGAHSTLECPCGLAEEGAARNGGGGDGDSAGDAMGPAERKAASRARWERLPLECPSAADARGTELERRKFAALDALAAARLYVGASRPQRVERLLVAGAAGDLAAVTALVDAGANVEGTNVAGETALFLAAQYGKTMAVHKLAEWAGADVRREAHGGCTPLAAAAAGGHTDTLRALLRNGACVREDRGAKPWRLSAAQLARSRGHNEAAALLEEAADAVGFASLPAPIAPPLPLSARVTTLIPVGDAHAGAGSYYIDDAFDEGFLCALERLFCTLPSTRECGGADKAAAAATTIGGKLAKKAPGGPMRRHYSDAERLVSDALRRALSLLPEGSPTQAHTYSRFLHYTTGGEGMAPHVDLSKKKPYACSDVTDMGTTHTFLLYLRDTEIGGATVLLRRVMEQYCDADVRAAVRPRRNRLLLFPHPCPHAGEPVVAGHEKLLLRGELV